MYGGTGGGQKGEADLLARGRGRRNALQSGKGDCLHAKEKNPGPHEKLGWQVKPPKGKKLEGDRGGFGAEKIQGPEKSLRGD